MTPLIDIDAACAGCFLNERTGGVCPMAREAYGLESMRAALRNDPKGAPVLVELVRRDAVAKAMAPGRALLPATNQTVSLEPEKEVCRAYVARPVQ